MDLSINLLQVYVLFTYREITTVLIPPTVPRNGAGKRFSSSTDFVYSLRIDAALAPSSRVEGNSVMRIVINSGLKSSGVVSDRRCWSLLP